MLSRFEWSNKKGTSGRSCSCGSWKDHWLNFSYRPWPQFCSVSGCSSAPALGAHVFNSSINGEKIIPMCSSCNGLTTTFTLRENVKLVSANKSETCE